MTVEAVEAAAYAALVAALPAAITAANAGYGDGVAIPAIVTWKRGLSINVQQTNPAQFPVVAVGTYRDDPLTTAEAQEWGSEVQRPVVVQFTMLGSSDEQAHLRTIRLVDVLKRVLRTLAPTLGGAVLYWPYDLAADWDPPVPFGVGSWWVTIGQVEATDVRCIEEPTS
jgi:hypothetical protein